MQTSSRRRLDGSVVVEVRGDIDQATLVNLRTAIIDAINTHPVRVVVDLGQVTFIDSTGLSVLIGGYDSARRHGIGFTVANPAPTVAHQLRVTGLYEHLTGSDPTPPGPSPAV